MITELRLENFKGHVDTRLALTRFTMLVGDNGSGKSSVLEALRLPGELDGYRLRGVSFAEPVLAEIVRRGTKQTKLSFWGHTLGQRWSTSLAIEVPEHGDMRLGFSIKDALGPFETSDTVSSIVRSSQLSRMTKLVGDTRLFRFRPEAVAASAYSDEPEAMVAEDGAQTAVVLAALKLADDEVFDRIEVAMRRLVPSIKRIRIKSAKVHHSMHQGAVIGSKLYFDFRGGQDVAAHHASHGTLIILALLTVLYGPNRPVRILLDDFDHALHPRAQMELVRMLKELLELDDFKETQIIATTHSPYVLDELEPEHVIAFALRDDGTVASKSLAEHPDAAKMKGALKTGQLWSLDSERSWVLA